MTYVEELRKSRDKATVAFHEFALSAKKFTIDHLFCFFEGKDNDYYVPRIKQFVEKYHPIRCGGREKVLEVYRLITNRTEYQHYKIAFFIDRDFNEPLPERNPPIFETPCYSIENFYVSTDVFKEILTNQFYLSRANDELFEECVALFQQRQQEFHEAVCLFNAWYACLIDIRNTQNRQTGVNLGDKMPKNFVEISLAVVSKNYDLEKIKHIFPQAIEVEPAIIEEKYLLFQNCEAGKVFRGKYEMEFLIKFIQLLLQNFLKNKVNFAFGDGSSLSHAQVITIFSAYAETPETLKIYLQRYTQA